MSTNGGYSKAVRKPYGEDTAVAEPEMGTITSRVVKIQEIDVQIRYPVTVDAGTEVVLRVNGRQLKRMTAGQAAALGLVTGVEPVYPGGRRPPANAGTEARHF